MTYSRFHLVFNLPVLLLLLPLAWWLGWTSAHTITLAALLGIVMIVTSPWDAIAVRYGIWDFPDDRIWRRINALPVEEYAFFCIQTTQVALLTFVIVHLGGWHSIDASITDLRTAIALSLLTIGWIVIAWRTRRIPTTRPHLHYAWHLFLWFAPVIVLQWIVGWPVLIPRWPAIVIPTLVMGTYLTLADVKAVREGIWFFDARRITGLRVASILPWEEMAFFYCTSLVVAQSFVILLPESARS